MTEKEFQKAIAVAYFEKDTAWAQIQVDFWGGFIRGTMRLYHGESEGTKRYSKWLAWADLCGDRRQAINAGCAAGYAGDTFSAAREKIRILMDVHPWAEGSIHLFRNDPEEEW